MKRMKSQIILTFAIMFIVGFIINGLYSIISLGESFFSFKVMADAIYGALIYLMFVWISTRPYISLAVIGICLMLTFVGFFYEGFVNPFSGWDWQNTVMTIYYITAVLIAGYQGDKLFAEYQSDKLLKKSK